MEASLVSNHSRSLQLRIDGICHAAHIGFFSSRSIGHLGYAFADLQGHAYQMVSPSPSEQSEEKSEKRIESPRWYSLASALSVSKASMERMMRGKKKTHRALFYALQVLEQTEDAILRREKHFVGQCREDKIREAMRDIMDVQSPYHKVSILAPDVDF